jgi:ABC-type antimicrobial peptide transport system, ATPase component
LSTLTVFENVAVPLELSGVAASQVDERVSALLDRVGIKHRAKFYPQELSGGEMQRTAIARALIHKPEIVVADEPTGNLDSDNGATILALLRSLAVENGQTVVMATHSREAAEIADRIVEMKDGRIVPSQKS